MSYNLSEISSYVTDKVLVSDLQEYQYISTDNMVVNRGGIVATKCFPTVSKVASFKKGDILISNIRPYFKKIWHATFDGGCSNDVLIIRAKEETDDKFLYYVLSSDNFFDYATATSKDGTKMPRGDKVAIMKYQVPDLVLEQQQKIAKILSALDEKIELNNKINENLHAQAQAIFKSWFVDFEPFGGTMPSDWEEKSLVQLADFVNGLAMQRFRPKENEKALPVLKIRELRLGDCDSSSELCSSTVKQEYIVNQGDIIFSWSGSLLVDVWSGKQCGLNQHLFNVKPKEFYGKWFVFLWVQYHLDNFIAIANDKATTMGHIKREHLEKAKVFVPAQKAYQQLDNLLNPILEYSLNLRIENKKLTQIRDTLLPKLMSGKLEV